MSALHVILPDATRAFIDEQVQAGLFGSASEMITALIEDARVRVASKELCDFLDEGESSDSIEFTDKWWEQEKASLKVRILEKRQP